MESNTETVAKRARVGPRTWIVLTMKMSVSIMFASKKCLVITIIVLDMRSKLRLELITCRNDNATQKFYRFRVVWKSSTFG